MYVVSKTFADEDNPSIYKGQIYLFEEDHPRKPSFKSQKFFSVGCFFLPFRDQGVQDFTAGYRCGLVYPSELTQASENDSRAPLPGIWTSVDSIAKTLHATILLDLGQESSDWNISQILIDPELLAYFSQNITHIKDITKENTDENGSWTLDWDEQLSDKPFVTNSSSSSSSHLGIIPSVISTTYLCQVPRLKSSTSLVVSVLTNNIILLSAMWKTFIIFMDFFILWRKR